MGDDVDADSEMGEMANAWGARVFLLMLLRALSAAKVIGRDPRVSDKDRACRGLDGVTVCWVGGDEPEEEEPDPRLERESVRESWPILADAARCKLDEKPAKEVRRAFLVSVVRIGRSKVGCWGSKVVAAAASSSSSSDRAL